MTAVLVISLFVLFVLFCVASVRGGVDSRPRWTDRQQPWWPGMPR